MSLDFRSIKYCNSGKDYEKENCKIYENLVSNCYHFGIFKKIFNYLVFNYLVFNILLNTSKFVNPPSPCLFSRNKPNSFIWILYISDISDKTNILLRSLTVAVSF